MYTLLVKNKPFYTLKNTVLSLSLLYNFKLYWMDKNFTFPSQSNSEQQDAAVVLEYEPDETSTMIVSLFARMYPGINSSAEVLS